MLDWVSRRRTQPPGQLFHRPTMVLLWQIVGFTFVWSFIQCTELRPNANLLKHFRSEQIPLVCLRAQNQDGVAEISFVLMFCVIASSFSVTLMRMEMSMLDGCLVVLVVHV